MNFYDWLLLLPIIGYCLYLIFRKKKKCSGTCSCCSGCENAKQ